VEGVLTWPDDAALVNARQSFKLYPGTVPDLAHQVLRGQPPGRQLHADGFDPASL
jgi:hypothetical protein